MSEQRNHRDEAPHQTSERWRERIEAAFGREMFRSQAIGVRVIAVVIPVVAAWISIENGIEGATTFFPVLFGLAVLLVLPYFLLRLGRYRPWHEYTAALLYTAAVFTLMFQRPPDQDQAIPLPLFLTFGNEAYLFVIVVAAVFTFSPSAILWRGFVAAAGLSLVTAWILSLPDTIGDIPEDVWYALSRDERIRMISDPHRVHIGKWIRQVITLLITSSALALFVAQMRRLVFQQAQAERERANLSRYFSQNMVDDLANTDEPLGPTRRQDVAVLFADIVGFTGWSEQHTPEQVIDLVRGFHARMERAIFENHGTVDKYIGDAVMATFGTPRPTPSDPANAVRCVQTMIHEVAQWNARRASEGLEPIRIGVGAHFGPVVLGDIGGEHRLEFAVLGDTVNVASRLERLTRELGCSAIVSDELVKAATDADPGMRETLALTALPGQTLRGRAGESKIWGIGKA